MGGFLKRGALMIVTFVTIILIILMGMSLGGRAKLSSPENIIGGVLTPIQRFLTGAGQAIDNTISPIFRFKTIEAENEKLKKEMEEMQKQLIQLTLTQDELEEIRELANALNYAKDNNFNNYVTANVSSKDPGNWFNDFTINAGQKHGIKKNSTVMNGQGLIGRVYEVGENWSKVVTIIDNRSSVSFEVLRNNEYVGVIRGSVNFELNGYLIDPEAEVLTGDKLITSGLSIYPKGILIGDVKEVVKKSDELLKNIIVEPAVNFKKIDKVFVLIPEQNE
ncbi:MAG: rod shape-determining protein MreC [Bacillota bacterium]